MKNPLESGERTTHRNIASSLAAISRDFYSRGWALGTSGNFSAVLSRNPFRLAITPTGAEKGILAPRQILEVNAGGQARNGRGHSSAETLLHLTVARVCGAGAVLHTHSIWGTVLSSEYARAGGIAIEGYEMLKGLAGIHTHEHREWLPILDNCQDMAALAQDVERALEANPASHGFLIRGHGLYTWGRNLPEAKRHTEILEFLLEVLGRRLSVGSVLSVPSVPSVRNKTRPGSAARPERRKHGSGPHPR